MKKTTFNSLLGIVFILLPIFSLAQLPEGSYLLVSDITANVTPSSDYKILKFDNNGENGELFTNVELSWPQDILIANIPNEGHRVLVSNLFSGKITKYDLDGNYVGDFATGIGGPTRMHIRNNELYVLQWFNQFTPEFVLRYSLDGTPLSNFTSTGTPLSIGIDWDAADNMYLSSYGRPSFNGNPAIPPQVHKFNSLGEFESVFISESDLVGPTNIWFDKLGSGDLWVIDYNNNSVKRFDSEGNLIGTIITGLSTPEGVAFLENGNFLIGNGTTGLIKMYDNNGTFIEDFIDAQASLAANLINTNAFYITPATLSLPELVKKKMSFLFPTIGNKFTFDANIVNANDNIIFNDLSGRQLENIELDNSMEWIPSNYDDGIYFISVISGEKKIIQKIILKN
ncbi:T9SS type A sorting domain-containing protein [Winogradskyella luteola]|uniref:T9SS type A sorting domain-containing protein n=1 Tax=Winogradskyella luteola TaxID=2828330 RepID=A0A9X1F9H9_9FLAO|nr:T9SS type A sorting domain-containing protein [Winogradskyella luteola]MBV7270002.1 T9SS type A sorting domain-containing protein [Winogradskyella luteola]